MHVMYMIWILGYNRSIILLLPGYACPCKNGGECVKSDEDLCICQPGYEGKLCELPGTSYTLDYFNKCLNRDIKFNNGDHENRQQ